MKIGTLNYHHAYNYGAVLQASALQYAISSLGHDTYIIDYRNGSIEKQYSFKPIKLNGSMINSIRADLVLLPFIKKKRQNFERWFSQYQKTDILTKDGLPSLAEEFDKIIVGSDQVWNMKCQGEDTTYLLDFVPDKKRIAYAASFGTYDVDSKYLGIFKKELEKFPFISVREERGTKIVENIIGKKVPCTMDPVLLVGRKYWESRMSKGSIDGKYIFVYQLGHGRDVPDFAKKLSKDTGLPLVFVTVHIGNIVQYRLSDRNKSDVSPEEFLSLLADASYILTNSFHAAALSLVFEKDFNVIVEGNGKATYNTRIFSLLERYSLEDRITDNYDKAKTSKVNYQIYRSKIDTDRQEAFTYLNNAIKG